MLDEALKVLKTMKSISRGIYLWFPITSY
jgi:hypothetical protein